MNETLDCAHAAAQARFFLLVELLELLRSQVFRNHVARNKLSIANRSQQIIDASVAIVTGHSFHLGIVIIEQLFRGELKARSFLFE